MTTPKQLRSSASRIAALRAIASPARQELVSELNHGPASARELAERLGRSRQALHFHLGVLERAGLIRVADLRGSGRDIERVYQVISGAAMVRARPRNPHERAATAKATSSLLRLTEREFRSAILHPEKGTGKPLAIAVRAKARLDERLLNQTRELIGELLSLFKAAKKAGGKGQMTSLTLILTPSRDLGAKKAPYRKGRV